MSFDDDLVAARPGLLRYGQKLTHSRTNKDDLTQEALARALEHREQFTEGGNLAAWLATILLNVHRNEQRRSAFERHEVRRAHPATQEVVAQIGEALRSLSPKLRDPLWLIATGFKETDAAERLGIPVGTVKTRVHRARAQLNPNRQNGKAMTP